MVWDVFKMAWKEVDSKKVIVDIITVQDEIFLQIVGTCTVRANVTREWDTVYHLCHSSPWKTLGLQVSGSNLFFCKYVQKMYFIQLNEDAFNMKELLHYRKSSWSYIL